MASLADKLQNLRLQSLKSGQALKEAILSEDHYIEAYVLRSLGDLHLQKGKLSRESSEFDKAAALYAAALQLCWTDPHMGQTVQHRIGYLEKLSRKLPHRYAPQYQWLSPDYWGIADSNVLRVAEICDKLDRRVGTPWHSVEEAYAETLVQAMANGDMFLEVEVLKSLGDLYLQKGRENSQADVSQVSKASVMYSKALTRCQDSGSNLKQTLRHRIGYTDNIIEAVRRQASRSRRRRLRNTIRSDVNQKHYLHPESSISLQSQHKDHLKEGESSLAKADLDSAEQHFAAALKTVHASDPTPQQYQREVEPLCKLGDIYSKRGQQTGDGGDFVKAAALYNAAIARSKDKILIGNIATAIRYVGKSFLKCILDIRRNVRKDNTEKHKKQLKEMRDQIKLEMETIDQQLDPYVHYEDDPCVREIEAKRAQAVRQLFEKIAQQRKEFITLLVDECIGLVGPPPCKYALIGLGSQATGLVTPYSDLEFAILVEKESERCLVYFRNLTHYLHLKVVNLGETILPALGIKSLNNFYSENPTDNWYYDSVTPRGFSFDGSMPKASKTPLGRQGTMNEPPSELICTPSNLVSKLQNDVTLYLKEGYHLATILRNPCLIQGDQDLIDTYKSSIMNLLKEHGGRMAQQLTNETLTEKTQRLTLKGVQATTVTATLIDVKKDLYRFPAVAVDCLALYSGIIPTTVWETIKEMENQQVISPNNAHHLTVLTGISAELRLRTYIENCGQNENLSALASMERMLPVHGQEPSLLTDDEENTNALKPVFHIKNPKQLFRYYYTSIPLERALWKLSEKGQLLSTSFDFYDKSSAVQGRMYSGLCKYRLAINYYSEALKEDGNTAVDKMDLFLALGDAWNNVGNFKTAMCYLEQALQIHRSIYGYQNKENSDIINYLGMTCHYLGDYNKAISYYKQALQMKESIYGQTSAHPELTTPRLSIYNAAHPFSILNNIGLSCVLLGDFRQAIGYYQQVLQSCKRMYGENTAHRETAIVLNNLGQAWQGMGDYRKAISYYEQALQMKKSIYGRMSAHPDFPLALNALGTVCLDLGEYRKAISYIEHALQMFRSINGQSTAHPHTAITLSNLGRAWEGLGDHWKVISHYEEALQMLKSIHGQTARHKDIAIILNNLGKVWLTLGDYRKATSYLESALQMHRSIHGQGVAHPNVAGSLSNMGEVWRNLGDFQNALSYHEQALQMRRSIFGPTNKHPDIAESLNNVGLVWIHVGNCKRAISYIEEALRMYRSIYGQGAAHPRIGMTLSNLAAAWMNIDSRKADSYLKQALQHLLTNS
ncbi:PREDICTED: uncharacterized protein LOC109472576 [Branchiostoma belcheri]|uniref:Uncharacterized protein LOC109472576 n=1 Tax=Branchiostoma belcheri TaxID=7741 RepID=A0A6P4Z1V5_BRABE|nr:PREDICTED: uncharacterized protein LOC109472576 [Branchiostoma belcheri]